MTVALAVTFLAILMIYAGVKGRSLRHLIVGQSIEGGTGSIVQASS